MRQASTSRPLRRTQLARTLFAVLPAPVDITPVEHDCGFSGLDELLVHPSGEVELARAKRWIATDADRGRAERAATQGAKAFTPFGHVKPAPLDALAAHLRRGTVLDLSPARLIPLGEPQAKGVFVMACLADETAVGRTVQ